MYCPGCFQDTMKIRSTGVIKLAFNGKARNTSLFTYNLQKETHEQLLAKLREKIVDFFEFYDKFENKTPIKTFEVYSSDFQCTSGNKCKIDINTKVSVIPLLYSPSEAKVLLKEEAKKFNIEIDI